VAPRTSDKSHGVRRLGFGVSGPHGTPLVSPEHTSAMIDHAFARGVRLFDTAPSYGAGEAERRLGEALKRLPRYECIVSTKAGIRLRVLRSGSGTFLLMVCAGRSKLRSNE